MSDILSGLKPQPLWKHFEEICRIPHGSGHEKALADYVLAWAKALKFPAKKDASGNVIISKPASPGKESSPGVILQGHLDMVWEKNSDVVHDFLKDPIKPVIRDGWVCASGTTLGADNGIGVAAAMEIFEDSALVHGPLEGLFTSEEETGLTGARGISLSALKGKYLLNLDSEEEGAFTIGCAGGADSDFTLPLARKAVKTKTAFRLMVSGLRGGHSGINIHEGRANAIKILARILGQAQTKFTFALYRMEGGNKHNAIPREAWAELYVEPAKIKAFSSFLQAAGDQIKAEYHVVEPGMKLAFDPVEPDPKDVPLTPKSQKSLLDFLACCPHGVISMNAEIPGLVETSINLAVLRTTKDKAKILCSGRSSVGSALEALQNVLKSLADICGAKVKQPMGYPGWTPNLQSPLLQKMKAVHLAVTGKEAGVLAIHAGLECGLIGKKYPEIDMISLGPTLQYPHSPDERVEIASVEKFWKLLVASLEALA
ncbi:MAG: aminoacyl-histidine dipeptidase [Candidatus Aminicenantes bacterium]|nr:aminoacyl-histidine dipeptidase [Candidatus Aminicenantes bacterium]